VKPPQVLELEEHLSFGLGKKIVEAERVIFKKFYFLNFKLK
jgi:hypothetical protein